MCLIWSRKWILSRSCDRTLIFEENLVDLSKNYQPKIIKFS